MMFVVSVASSSMELARLANFPVMIVHYCWANVDIPSICIV